MYIDVQSMKAHAMLMLYIYSAIYMYIDRTINEGPCYAHAIVLYICTLDVQSMKALIHTTTNKIYCFYFEDR